MMIGIFAVIAFNVADTYFIGQLGTKPLAAISLTFPVVMSFGSLAMGLGVGASSVIARAMGEGDRDKVQKLTTHALILATSIVSIFIVVGMMTIDPLFVLLGAKPEVLPLIHQYMQIWYLGMVFLVVPMVGNSAIRAIGDARFPAIVMVVAGVINLILDPLLIFGWLGFPKLGIQGAAIATVFSRMVTFGAAIWVLHSREQLIRWEIPRWSELVESWKEILYVGIPSAGNQMVGPVTIGIVTAMVSIFGNAVIAGFGVASRIEAFAMVGIFAVSAGTSPIVGQNWGAKKYARVYQVVRLAFRVAIVYGLVITVVLLALSEPLTLAFNKNVEVSRAASMYLWLVPVSYGAMGCFMIASNTFNAIGRPLPASVLTILRAFVVYVPVAYFGRWLFDEKGVFAAACFANLIAGGTAYLWVQRTCFKRMDEAAAEEKEHEPQATASEVSSEAPA
jgi:putative MATE family efflux protein